MKRIRRTTICFCIMLILALVCPLFTSAVQAKDLDSIRAFDITAELQSDGTVKMKYHIKWDVLNDTYEGPLEWVKIGAPNQHVTDLKALSDNIKSIKSITSNGYFIRVDFKKQYKAGQTVDFEFEFIQDYIYEMNSFRTGETVYTYTPGWFDDIKVKKLTIKWKYDDVVSYTPAGIIDEDGYITWEKELDKGDKFTVTVTYPNTAYNFDSNKSLDTVTKSKYSSNTTSYTDNIYYNSNKKAHLPHFFVFLQLYLLIL